MRGGVERNQELADGRIYLDTRSLDQRIGDTLKKPRNLRNLLWAMSAAGVVIPPLIPPLLVLSAGFYGWWKWTTARHRLPVRYPEHLGLIDPSEADDNMGQRTGAGIEYMGVERLGRTVDDTEEIWASNSDVRTHRVIMGTTGAGKTQTLLSTLFNPLCWGSGFSMTDGKAQVDVTADIFVMAWIFWREDDVLVLNYMRGGQDRFKEMVDRRPVGERRSRVSNTWNPFSRANHETINQIIDSVMDKATGDGAQWQAKAINMKNALVQTISYLRARGTMMMSISAIREHMSLDNMIKLALRNDIPPQAAAAIRNYLSLGPSGFSWAKAKAGKTQDQEAYIQHSYLTGQFARTMGLMTDTYNDIFGDEISEYDTSDVILNNRISITMIPTLEKGVEEAGNLGKIQIASAKMMMAENLGYEIEGIYEDIVDNRPTNTNRPFYMVMDELGYYFAPGIDLMFAQGRSLNIALTAAGQDFQAMAKNNKSEVESMIANSRFKISMKLEDPKETFEIFQKAAGEGAVARLSGFEAQESSGGLTDGGYNRSKMLSVERVGRISLQELKRLGPGDGVLISGDKVIRFRGFNLFMKFKFDKKKVDIRINTFVPIAQPEEFGAIASLCKPVDQSDAIAARLYHLLSGSRAVIDDTRVVDVRIMAALSRAAAAMGGRNIPPIQRGIVLFTEAVRAMNQTAPDTGDVDEVPPDAGGSHAGSGQSAHPDWNDPAPAPAPAPAGRPDSSWLNDPPIEKALAVHASSDPGFDDNPEFGAIEIPSASGPQVAMTADTREMVRRIIVGVSGGVGGIAARDIEKEIVATDAVIDGACQFGDPGVGSASDPAINSSIDEVTDIFDEIDDMLKDCRRS